MRKWTQVAVLSALVGACSVPAWKGVQKLAAPPPSPSPSPLVYLFGGPSDCGEGSVNFRELSIGEVASFSVTAGGKR